LIDPDTMRKIVAVAISFSVIPLALILPLPGQQQAPLRSQAGPVVPSAPRRPESPMPTKPTSPLAASPCLSCVQPEAGANAAGPRREPHTTFTTGAAERSGDAGAPIN
jgi:hypothetical protein